VLLAGGSVVLEDAFERPGLDAVQHRIVSLDQKVIDEQVHLIDLSFVNKLPPAEEQTGFEPLRRNAGQALPTRARLLAEAARIGDALVATMIEGEDELRSASWIAPQIIASDDEQWTPGTPGSDLYGGGAGIALTLAGLARETRDGRYRDAALRVLEPIEAKFCEGFDTGAQLATGGMGGLGGTIYAVSTARRLLDLPGQAGPARLAAMLADMVGTRQRPPRPDYDIEIIGGVAGALAVVLALHRHAVSDDDRAQVAAAVRTVAAEELAAIGDRASAGWRVTDYTGYAHGTMGIASVLIEYGWTFDDPTARERGALMLRTVLDAYDESDGDWPRTWDGPQRSYAWCHGAPGMLLGCLAAVRHDPASVPEDVLSRLAELSVRRGLGNNPSYCHGDLGTVEVLTLAEREVPGLLRPWDVGDLYPRVFAQVVERYEQRFDTKYSYSNSLMVGQSGAAWSILHHLDPETYPSILRLG
jgi:lantibiotic modifying enzyme